MTLNTKVAIMGGAINAHELFCFLRPIVGTPEGVEPRTEADSYFPEVGVKELRNPIGIGAQAILDVRYGADGPMLHVCDKYCTDYEDSADHHEREMQTHGAAAVVSFDTAYGYSDEQGRDCSQLHADYIRTLGDWLERKGLTWRWQDEYTGTWHEGREGLDEYGFALA